ncbi:MAG TPA: hypothetical protein VIJ94_02275 [Caulobacteraceae bacterium]
MPKFKLPPAVVHAVKPLLTRVVGCGAAVSCAAGIGLGAWLEPPSMHTASAATVVNLPVQQGVGGDDPGALPALAYAQSISVADPDQTATVSPPADPSPAKFAVAQADFPTQPAAGPERAPSWAPDDPRMGGGDADPADLPTALPDAFRDAGTDGHGPPPAASDDDG